MATYYASVSGTAGAAGSLVAPWSLRRALDVTASPHPGAGDTLYIRGGTYYGGFTASIAGSAGNPVVIRPYPGEQYVIEQYIYGTLTSSIDATTNNIGWTPHAGISISDMDINDEFVIDGDKGPGSGSPASDKAEACRVLSGSFAGGPNGHTSLRALNGTGVTNAVTGYSHTAGALIWASVNGLSITGDYQQWWACDVNNSPWLLSTIKCSNPNRSFTTELSNNATGPTWQRSKAGITASDRTGLEFYGFAIRDSNDGIFITGAGGGHVIADLLAYNNGHVDNIRGHGQPLYIHTETSADALDVISFSNFGSGSKFYGVNGVVRNCTARRICSFNNAAPAAYTGNPIVSQPMPSNKYVEGNWFIGSENDVMDSCAMYDSVCWMPYDAVCTFTHVRFGHAQQCTNFIIDNNWFIGGDQLLLVTLQRSLTYTRNVHVQNTTGASSPNVQSDDNFFIDVSTGDTATWTWGTGGNINSYYAKNRLISTDLYTYPFLFKLNGTASLNEFNSPGHQRYDVPADSRDFLGASGLTLDYHDQALPTGTGGFDFRTAVSTHITTRSYVAVVKWDGTATGTFSLPTTVFTAAGFSSGDTYRIYNSLNYEAGGADLITGTYSGTSVSIASGSFTYATPEGYTTQSYRGNTWSLGFGVLIIYRIAAGSGTGTAMDNPVSSRKGIACR